MVYMVFCKKLYTLLNAPNSTKEQYERNYSNKFIDIIIQSKGKIELTPKTTH